MPTGKPKEAQRFGKYVLIAAVTHLLGTPIHRVSVAELESLTRSDFKRVGISVGVGSFKQFRRRHTAEVAKPDFYAAMGLAEETLHKPWSEISSDELLHAYLDLPRRHIVSMAQLRACESRFADLRETVPDGSVAVSRPEPLVASDMRKSPKRFTVLVRNLAAKRLIDDGLSTFHEITAVLGLSSNISSALSRSVRQVDGTVSPELALEVDAAYSEINDLLRARRRLDWVDSHGPQILNMALWRLKSAGHTQSEIARVIGMDRETVDTRIHAARPHAYEVMEPELAKAVEARMEEIVAKLPSKPKVETLRAKRRETKKEI